LIKAASDPGLGVSDSGVQMSRLRPTYSLPTADRSVPVSMSSRPVA